MMDPSGALLRAAQIAATGMLTESGRQIAKRFFSAISARFKGKPSAEMVLEKFREKPKVWAAPLQEALEEAGAPRDDQLIAIARELLEAVGDTTIQIARGQVVAQTGGDVGTLIQSGGGSVSITVAGAPDIPDLGMDLRTFETNVKPALVAQGYEVSISSVDKLLGHLVEGWEEIIMTVGGRRGRVVITVNGKVDGIPIKRKPPWADLSKGPHTMGVRAQIWKKVTFLLEPDIVRAGGKDFPGNEWRLAHQELQDADFIRYKTGVMYPLTPNGDKLAKAMLAALGEDWLTR